jgi:hypothetical protein
LRDAGETENAAVEKLVYALWKRQEDSDEAFQAEVLGDTAGRLLEQGARSLRVNLVDGFVAHTKAVRITKLDPPLAGMLSFWVDSAREREPLERTIAAATSRFAGYLVAESVATPNTTHVAPLGERTPGINVVACIEKPAWIDWEAWLERWLDRHRQVAVETQCTYAYVRNVVVRRLGAAAPPWSGIVEEGFPAAAVTDPMQWYCTGGSPEKLQQNVQRMIESCRSFLELERVESHPMSEYRITDWSAGAEAGP